MSKTTRLILAGLLLLFALGCGAVGLGVWVLRASAQAEREAWEEANSEHSLCTQADRAKSAGEIGKAESLFKRAIELHDSMQAKYGLVSLYADAQDFERVFLLERTMNLSFPRIADKEWVSLIRGAFGSAHADVASRAFDRKDWATAINEYHAAWERWLPVQGYSGSAVESLRNAVAAASNAGELGRARQLIEEFRKSPLKDTQNDDVAEMEKMLRELESRRGG